MTDPVSRYEFAELARQVMANALRLDAIDANGTRGVAVVGVQVQELSKDFAKHEERHDQEQARRLSARRWVIGAAIAAVAAIDGPLVTVLLAVHWGGH